MPRSEGSWLVVCGADACQRGLTATLAGGEMGTGLAPVDYSPVPTWPRLAACRASSIARRLSPTLPIKDRGENRPRYLFLRRQQERTLEDGVEQLITNIQEALANRSAARGCEAAVGEARAEKRRGMVVK